MECNLSGPNHFFLGLSGGIENFNSQNNTQHLFNNFINHVDRSSQLHANIY